jgi:hypothetical protein
MGEAVAVEAADVVLVVSVEAEAAGTDQVEIDHSRRTVTDLGMAAVRDVVERVMVAYPLQTEIVDGRLVAEEEDEAVEVVETEGMALEVTEE